MYPLGIAHGNARAHTDGVFIGPYDLSLSHGLPPPSPDPVPEAEELIQKILAAAHAKGKKWCERSPFILNPLPSCS